MPVIQVLKRDIHELIAAGEVVERPASVVKELVENAIDAKATVIEIEIQRNGLSLIRVTDNGCGIPRDEVPTAFLRHATSKIRAAKDLDEIHTLGFRGEALAAICAVSKIRMLTRPKNEPDATDYRAQAGEMVLLAECGAPEGTTIFVSELFFNTPARMKFLKKDIHEGNAVQVLAEQLALSHPEIGFRFIRENKTVFSTSGDGELFSAIHSILPREVSGNMVALTPLSDSIQVRGYITAPGAARSSRTLQFVFVNGRFIKSRSISAAAEEACKTLVMAGKFPSFVLSLSLPADDVDVNVHPAKTEVRFKNDREVFSAVYMAVKCAVMDYAGSFDRQQSQIVEENHGRYEPSSAVSPVNSTSPTSGSWQNESDGLPKSIAEFVPQNADRSFVQETLEQAAAAYEWSHNQGVKMIYSATVSPKGNLSSVDASAPKNEIRLIGELFETYLIAQYGDRMMMIDKHAAHERILYELLNENDPEISRQILLDPVVITVSLDEKQSLCESGTVLNRLGFSVEEFGRHEVIVREIPTYLSREAAPQAVLEIAQKLSGQAHDIAVEDKTWLLHSVACRAAIKAGHHTSAQEMIQLTAEIISSRIPKYCPHGRPVYIMIEKGELEKKFGRA